MNKIRKSRTNKITLFVCLTFFLTASGFHGVIADAKDVRFPIGEMVSKGGVKFEAKENVWKDISASHFPIFEKGKIRTEQGTGIVTLTSNSRIEIAQNSVISFEQSDRLLLTQGKVNFRIPPSKEMTIKVGSITVAKPRIQQASKGTTIIPNRNEETIGSLTLHSNGSVTVRNLQGSLSVLDQDRVVIAALSSKESITIPSTMATGRSNKMVAQAGEVRQSNKVATNVIDQEWTYLGLNAIEWIAVGYAAILVGVLAYVFWPNEDKKTSVWVEQAPVCP